MKSRNRLGMLALLSAVMFAALLPGNASAATHEVSIIEFDFVPSPLTVAPGDTVVWTNDGFEPHTVTAEDDSFDSGVFQPDAVFEVTF